MSEEQATESPNDQKKSSRQMFSIEEDDMLSKLVKEYGEKNWRTISKHMPNRTTRQCRERYRNYLSPQIKNGPWTTEEDLLLEQKYLEYGPKWATIAQFFKTRSDVNIKNRWASNRHKTTRTCPQALIEQLLFPRNKLLLSLQALLPIQRTAPPVKLDIWSVPPSHNEFESCLDAFEIQPPVFEIDERFNF